jgi:copper chaperone CopZ
MAVRRVNGVKSVDGNAKDKTVTVQYDPDVTTIEDVQARMKRIGYRTEVVGG